jgi:hypothetical protein
MQHAIDYNADNKRPTHWAFTHQDKKRYVN